MKQLTLFLLSIPLLVACAASPPSAAHQVAGQSTAQPALVGTAQADQYMRDAKATMDAQAATQQAIAWQLASTASAATSSAEVISAQATATAVQAETVSALAWAMTTDAATAQAMSTASAATAQAVSAATQQARLDAAATSEASATGTAVAVVATRQAYELAEAQAQAHRQQVISMGTTVFFFFVGALLLAAGIYVLYRALPTLINRLSVVRYGQHGNPLILSSHNGRTVVTEPLRMLQAALEIGEDGQAHMPRLSPEDVQAFVTGGALRVLMEQAAHAPGHAPQLPSETTTTTRRRLGPAERETTTTERYAPVVMRPHEAEPPALPDTPALAQLPTTAARPMQLLDLIDAALRRNEIMLGIEEGQPVTAPVRDLCHVGIAGATGGGKSTVMRLLLTQLLASGASVVLADPHYADVDPKSGDDWRTIRAGLHLPPSYRYRDIRELLGWLVREMETRLEMRRRGEIWASSLFLAFDEYPLIAQNVPEAADLVGRILREGRKVDVLVLGAFQDALVRSIGGDGAVRENYRTAYYLGGDQHTARVLLDVRGRVDDSRLGRGVALLRSPATTPAREVSVPRLGNEAIAAILPPSTGVEGALGRGNEAELSDFGRGAEGATEGALEGDAEGAMREEQVLQMLRAGASITETIRELWGVSSGRRYQEAAAIVGDMIRRRV